MCVRCRSLLMATGLTAAKLQGEQRMESWSRDGGMCWKRDRHRKEWRVRGGDWISLVLHRRPNKVRCTATECVYLCVCVGICWTISPFNWGTASRLTWPRRNLQREGTEQAFEVSELGFWGCSCELHESEIDCGHHGGAEAHTVASQLHVYLQLSVWCLQALPVLAWLLFRHSSYLIVPRHEC